MGDTRGQGRQSLDYYQSCLKVYVAVRNISFYNVQVKKIDRVCLAIGFT